MQNTENLDRSPVEDLSLKKYYDIAIIGAGVSCSYTLIHYIALLTERSLVRPMRVAIVERSGEFWSGIPYGKKNASHSLIISSLKEFLPPAELAKFKQWLNKNRSWIFEIIANRKAGLLAYKWLQSHADEISTGRWDELFVPRYTFGLYVKECLDRIVADATSRGILTCDRIAAEAVDVREWEGLYEIETASESQIESFLTAKKVVLAIGSPPSKELDTKQANVAPNDAFCYIDNMYQPSQGFNLDRIGKVLDRSVTPPQNQVLIVGSNANALESIYSLVNSSETRDSIDKFIVVSPSGKFPHRVDRPSAFKPQYLDSLKKSEDHAAESITAEDILIAVQKDLDRALAEDETIGSVYTAISQGVFDLLDGLVPSEQKLFVSVYGTAIGKLQRRAGAEYLDAIERLISDGKLEFLKGRFVKTVGLPSGGIGFEYINDNREKQIHSTPVRIAINCTGFQDVKTSSSTLIKNLIRRGICIPNRSLNGFEVSENFETHQNFYLIGPLMAGNINDKFKVWHSESINRIVHLSKMLAEILAQS